MRLPWWTGDQEWAWRRDREVNRSHVCFWLYRFTDTCPVFTFEVKGFECLCCHDAIPAMFAAPGVLTQVASIDHRTTAWNPVPTAMHIDTRSRKFVEFCVGVGPALLTSIAHWLVAVRARNDVWRAFFRIAQSGIATRHTPVFHGLSLRARPDTRSVHSVTSLSKTNQTSHTLAMLFTDPTHVFLFVSYCVGYFAVCTVRFM